MIPIEDFVGIEVVDFGDDDLNRGISEYSLSDVTDDSLLIDVIFDEKIDISADLQDPDSLIIKFYLPGMITDPETLEGFDGSVGSQALSLTLIPQMTVDELEEREAMAETAKNVGGSLTLV